MTIISIYKTFIFVFLLVIFSAPGGLNGKLRALMQFAIVVFVNSTINSKHIDINKQPAFLPSRDAYRPLGGQELTGNFVEALLDKEYNLGISTFNKRYIIGAEYSDDNGGSKEMTAFFNGEPFHSPAIAMSGLMNGLLKYVTSASDVIHTSNFPFPRTLKDNSLAVAGATLGMRSRYIQIIIFLLISPNSY